MKTYSVTVTARGGLWRGKRTQYAILVEAENKTKAGAKALDIAEREIEEDYDSLYVGKITVSKGGEK